jgi:hypothetical protein
MRLPYPSLSDLHADPKGRVCFYGYDVLQDWLVNYAKDNIKTDDTDDEITLLYTGVRIMRALTGIKTLGMETALVDPTVPDDTVIHGYGTEERMVPIISICTTERESYQRRPSQAQVDQLSQILGKRPRWWIDYEPPSSYMR